ncbi:MAG: hypothetical protein ACF8R9_14440 [Phycisphaerales bacterium JB054]
MSPSARSIAQVIYACLLATLFAQSAFAQSTDASRIDRSQAVGTWEGIMGTQARSATLLRFRLTLRTGLESSDHPESELNPVSEEDRAALEEARARTNAIREGRDPDAAVSKSAAARESARKNAESLESARLQRERNRSDRVEGILEFTPLYGEGDIRTGLSGVPSVKDGSGSCEVVGYLNPHSGALTLNLIRWADQPKKNLLQTNELQLVLDPAEPVLFGEWVVRRLSYSAFTPVIAWREGQAPETELARIESVAYPNHFGGDRITRLRRNLSDYTRKLKYLESQRPIDTLDADFEPRYARAESQFASELASNQSAHDKLVATYDEQEADLDAQEAAGDLSESQLRRIASKRESIAERRTKAAEQLKSRNTKARDRRDGIVEDLDKQIADRRAEFEEELAEHNAKRDELDAAHAEVQRTITIDNDVVAAWVERIAEEHPQVTADENLNFTAPESRHAILNALRDDVFTDTFGAAYENLTDYDMLLAIAYFDMRHEQYDDEGEVQEFQTTTSAPQQNRGRVRSSPTETQAQPNAQDHAQDHAARQAQWDEQRELLYGATDTIKAPFDDDYELNLLRLSVQRRTLNWINRVRTDLDAIQPDADTFERLDAIESALALRTHHLRPSEQDAAALLTIAAREEHADATARHIAQRTIDDATGQRGIATLSYFWASHPALNRLVSDTTRSRINLAINAALDRAIGDIAGAIRGRVETLSKTKDPYDALELGAEIYRDILAQLGPAKNRPGAQKLLDIITSRRAQDLLDVRKAVIAEILAADSAEEARRIASTVVTLPSDADTDAGELIQLNVSLRAVQLEAEAIQALFSEREWTLMDQNTGRLDVPNGYSAPSEDEVRLATLRVFALDGGELLDPSTCMHVVPGLGKLNVKVRMELRDVQISSVTRLEDGSYRVLYTFRRRITPEGSLSYLGDEGFWQGELLLDMLDAFGDNVVETSYEVFQLTPYGWYSPTLLARLDLASAMQPLRVLSGEKRDR